MYYSVKALISNKLAFSLPVCTCYFVSWVYFYLIWILAVLLILTHSFYNWDKDKNTNHLYLSFEGFINSPHSVVIASAVKQAIKSYAMDVDLLCEAIIQIVLDQPLGM